MCVFAWVLSHVWLFETLWTVAHQAPLSSPWDLIQSKQEYWGGLPFPPPRPLPDPETESESLVSPANAGDARDTGSIPGWGIPLGEGNDNPLQHSCLKISMDREAWQATVHGVAKNGTWQSTHIQCRELRSYMLHGAAKKNKQKQNMEAEGRQCSLLTQNGINH